MPCHVQKLQNLLILLRCFPPCIYLQQFQTIVQLPENPIPLSGSTINSPENSPRNTVMHARTAGML